jgi:hypothetical protein
MGDPESDGLPSVHHDDHSCHTDTQAMTWTAPDLTDDDLAMLDQIAAIDWSDLGYTVRLARSLQEGAQYNAALVKREKRKTNDRPNLFTKGDTA